MPTAPEPRNGSRSKREDPAYAKRIGLALIVLVAIAVILMALVQT